MPRMVRLPPEVQRVCSNRNESRMAPNTIPNPTKIKYRTRKRPTSMHTEQHLV